MLLNIISLLFLGASLCDASSCIYDRYTGDIASEELLAYYEATGVKDTCTKEVEYCDPNERRRVDGSCNNLDHPVRGTYFEPVYRVLPANYYNGWEPAKAADGTDKKLGRVVRNNLMGSVKSNSLDFTQALPGYGIFTFVDVASPHDLIYFLRNKTDCCTPEGMKDARCTPNIIPEDDPVHRFTGIRCMNLTSPLIYSDYGCTNDTVASPIEQGTATFDLSGLYNKDDGGTDRLRSFKSGLLTVDVDEDGIIWPPNGENFCALNQPGETRCFGNYNNVLLETTLLNIWYMRQHNVFATELAAVNPCWSDDQLFDTARDMNIAFATQVYFYEWCATLMGKENLIKAGVLSSDSGHRDVYDPTILPQVSLEYTYVLRWFHTVQNGPVHMYDTEGNFLNDYPIVNLTFRPGFLGVDDNMVKSTPHMFRQAAGKFDYASDPDFLDMGVPYIQRSVDILTSDLYKSRLLGFAPYVDYVEYCTGDKITSFDDLLPHIEQERINQLKEVYTSHNDIDLLAGIWVEKYKDYVPSTLACLLTEFLYKAVRFDRHFYERDNRPYPYSKDQLLEIRKSSLAALLCNVGDGVTEVQPQAFRLISDDNPLTPCSEIPNIDYTKWADPTCDCATSDSDDSSSENSSEN